MIKSNKKTREDNFFKLEMNNHKQKKQKVKQMKSAEIIDIDDIDITNMSASEIAKMYEDEDE
jgi:hypothetical protein